MSSRTLFLLGLLFLLGCFCATAALQEGFEDAGVDDDDVLVAAQQASRQLSREFPGKYHYKLAKVVTAKRMVIPGIKYRHYHIELIVGKTSCDKKEMFYEFVEDCDFADEENIYKKCTVLVLKTPQGTHRLAASGCSLGSKRDLE